jgi:hypothetical protein
MAVLQVREQPRRYVKVVLQEVALGQTKIRPEDFLQIRQPNGSAATPLARNSTSLSSFGISGRRSWAARTRRFRIAAGVSTSLVVVFT